MIHRQLSSDQLQHIERQVQREAERPVAAIQFQPVVAAREDTFPSLKAWHAYHSKHGRIRRDVIVGEFAWWYCSCGADKFVAPKDASL